MSTTLRQRVRHLLTSITTPIRHESVHEHDVDDDEHEDNTHVHTQHSPQQQQIRQPQASSYRPERAIPETGARPGPGFGPGSGYGPGTAAHRQRSSHALSPTSASASSTSDVSNSNSTTSNHSSPSTSSPSSSLPASPSPAPLSQSHMAQLTRPQLIQSRRVALVMASLMVFIHVAIGSYPVAAAMLVCVAFDVASAAACALDEHKWSIARHVERLMHIVTGKRTETTTATDSTGDNDTDTSISTSLDAQTGSQYWRTHNNHAEPIAVAPQVAGLSSVTTETQAQTPARVALGSRFEHVCSVLLSWDWHEIGAYLHIVGSWLCIVLCSLFTGGPESPFVVWLVAHPLLSARVCATPTLSASMVCIPSIVWIVCLNLLVPSDLIHEWDCTRYEPILQRQLLFAEAYIVAIIYTAVQSNNTTPQHYATHQLNIARHNTTTKATRHKTMQPQQAHIEHNKSQEHTTEQHPAKGLRVRAVCGCRFCALVHWDVQWCAVSATSLYFSVVCLSYGLVCCGCSGLFVCWSCLALFLVVLCCVVLICLVLSRPCVVVFCLCDVMCFCA